MPFGQGVPVQPNIKLESPDVLPQSGLFMQAGGWGRTEEKQ
jgi:hypothetical protein